MPRREDLEEKDDDNGNENAQDAKYPHPPQPPASQAYDNDHNAKETMRIMTTKRMMILMTVTIMMIIMPSTRIPHSHQRLQRHCNIQQRLLRRSCTWCASCCGGGASCWWSWSSWLCALLEFLARTMLWWIGGKFYVERTWQQWRFSFKSDADQNHLKPWQRRVLLPATSVEKNTVCVVFVDWTHLLRRDVYNWTL